MKFFLLIFCCVLLSVGNLEGALAALPVAKTEAAFSAPPTMDRATMEAHLKRKLKFRERIAFGIIKRKYRRQRKQAENETFNDGLAIPSLVIGIGSLFLLLTSLWSFFPAIIGLIFGTISLIRISRNPGVRKGKSLAITGIVINGGIAILGLLLVFFSYTGF